MVTVVFGKRGTGKTTFIKSEVAALSRVLIFDPMAEYSDVAQSFSDLDSFLERVERVERGLFRLALQPADVESAFPFVCRSAWSVGDVSLVIDETSLVASATSYPPELGKLIRQGRHRGVHLIAASQRASEVPRALTSNAGRVVTFAQTEPIDQQYLSRYVSAEVARNAAGLPRFRYIEHRPLGGGVEPQETVDTEDGADLD